MKSNQFPFHLGPCDDYFEEEYLLCSDCTTTTEQKGKVEGLLQEKLAILEKSTLINMTQSKSDMIVSCTFMGKVCNDK